MTLFLALAWCILVALLLLRAVLQFRAYRTIGPEAAAAGGGKVTAVIPARNEAQNIGSCLRALLLQAGADLRLEAVVVDDGSTDGTGDIARRTTGGRDTFRIIEAGPLPQGWTGKAHACWRGSRRAGGEWLCFLDADTVPAPELLAAAVGCAEREGIDFLSLEPEQTLGSFWERVIIPGGMFIIAFFGSDLRGVNDPASADAAANGQFLLVSRTAYEAVGGHAAVRGEISEDTALARRFKENGFRTLLLGTRDLIRVRMYHRFGEIWEGLSKNAVNMVASRPAAVAVALGALLVGWSAPLLPLWGAAEAARQAATVPTAACLLATAGSLALLGTHVAGARYFRIAWWYGLLFPLAYTVVAAIILNSLRAYWAGEVRWKGRIYAPAAASPGTAQEEPAALPPELDAEGGWNDRR